MEASDLHIEDEAEDEDIRAELKKFLVEHSEVYDEITAKGYEEDA